MDMKSVDAKIDNYENTVDLLKKSKADYNNKVAALKAFKVAYTDGYGVRDGELIDFAYPEEYDVFCYLEDGVNRSQKDLEKLLKTVDKH